MSDTAAAPPAAQATGEEETQRVVTAEIGEMTELESMCPRCEENGTTRLMITRIPHFREVIVSSFECPHCGERNNEVQFGGQFGEFHTYVELSVTNAKDMNRQIVKSEWATIKIPQLELEIPPETQRGMLNTVEGLLVKTIEGLQMEQPVRRIMQPEVAQKIDEYCEKLESFRGGTVPFTVAIDDPAGNSYIEPLFDHFHPTIDPKLSKSQRPRTEIDRQLLGLAIDYNTQRTESEQHAVDDGELPEVMCMDTQCSACGKTGEIKTHMCDIPYFKETLIMAFKCEFCGYKSNEIKSGGAISEKGLRLTLRVENETDLKRDILKSNTASLEIPEVNLELAPGTLGGFFSSVEGTLLQIIESLGRTQMTSFDSGDSAKFNPDLGTQTTMKSFVEELEELKQVKRPFTLIIDDPLANIYIQNPRAHLPPPEDADPQLKREEYVRSFEQDEELGLHDMHV